MKLHRAVTLLLMILLSALVVAVMTAEGLHGLDPHSLVALGVVVAAAAAAGIGFSWRRYFTRRP